MSEKRSILVDMMPEPEIQLLLERINNGQEKALIQLHDEFIRLVYSVAFHIVENKMDAEEVSQDVFLKLWHKAETYNPAKGRFVTWLLTITRRTAIDKLRRASRSAPITQWEEQPAPHNDDLQSSLASALELLSLEQRQAIHLAYFQGMSHVQIAGHLDRPLGTVKSHLRQGMARLREIWLEEAAAGD